MYKFYSLFFFYNITHAFFLCLSGSNNMESGNDIKLLNGKDVKSMAMFQNEFELSGMSTCKVKSPGVKTGCSFGENSKCAKLFSSPFLKNCLWLLDNKPFLVSLLKIKNLV